MTLYRLDPAAVYVVAEIRIFAMFSFSDWGGVEACLTRLLTINRVNFCPLQERERALLPHLDRSYFEL